MEENGTSSSDYDSEFEAYVRSKCSKRRHALSTSSESSDSSIQPRSISNKKKPRGLLSSASDSQSESESSSESEETSASDSSANISLELPLQELGNSFLDADSDDSVIFNRMFGGTRSRPFILLSDSDESSSVSENEEANGASRITASVYPPPPTINNELSDSGDENAEKCAICLRGISKQEVGCPEGCDHMFCLTCLVEWAKKSNKCPLDRQQFSIILVRENKHGEVVRQLPVDQPPPLIDVEDFIYCWVCGGSDRDDELLLCDGCDRGFHLDCLRPPLLAVPQVAEWFCPHCTAQTVGEARGNNSSFAGEGEEGERHDEDEIPPANGRRQTAQLANNQAVGQRARRPPLVRTRQPTPLWSAVQQALMNYSDQQNEDLFRAQQQQPSTSGLNQQPRASSSSTSQPAPKVKNTVKRNRVTGKKKKKTVRKRRRATRRVTTIRKKIKIKNEDGTFTEEIIAIKRKAVKGRKKARKKVVKKKKKTVSRRPKPDSSRTVRERLARTLRMMAPSNPRQLLPEVSRTASRREDVRTGVNVSRARAGIPTLHIFEPRHELAPVSSGSEDIDVGEGSLGVLARRRVGISSRHLERSKAVELLRNTPARPPRLSRPPPQPLADSQPTDLLGSILEYQTIWHSKKANVTIRNDGTVELQEPKKPDVRTAGLERATMQAPIHSTSGSQPPGFRPYSSAVSDPVTPNQGLSQAPSGSSQRFGAPYNDREGYTSFLNSMPPGGPTPFQRGGPPLRFRMPTRPQLRRIPLHPRPRQIWPQEDDEDSGEVGTDDQNQSELVNEAESEGGRDVSDAPKANEDDVDLYSDIETNNAEKDDEGSASQGGVSAVYPALGPPPAPPAFLLTMGLDEEKKNEEEYDPAEPCDSDEEMVIDETQGQKEGARLPMTPPSPPPMPSTPPRDDDEECPIFNIYSSASMEFSRQNEEERARVFSSHRPSESEEVDAQVKKSKERHTETNLSPRRAVGTRLSFNVDNSPNLDGSQDSSLPSPSSKSKDGIPSSPEYDDEPHADHLSSSKEFLSSATSEIAVKEPRSPSSIVSGSSSPMFPTEDVLASPKMRKLSESEVGKVDSDQDAQLAQEPETSMQRVRTGLEGLDVEEVSSDLEENDFNDNCSISSLSLSGMSVRSRQTSPFVSRKRRKKKRQRLKSKSDKCASEEGEIDSDKEKRKAENSENKTGDENKSDSEKKKKKKKRSLSRSSERQVLGSKENKKGNKEDLSWKKPSKKDKNYREGRKGSKERDRSRDRRSPSPKKDKKKGRDRKNSDKEKKKEIERYDVRKVVKNKVVRKTDAFGRDLPSRSLSLSKSRSRSRSKSRSKSRGRVRNIRRGSRSLSKSPARGFRRGRSPVRRRFQSPSRKSPSPRRNKKKPSEKKGRSRSRGPRRSWSRRRSGSRSPRGSRPVKKLPRRKSYSRSFSLSPPPRSPSPVRVRHSPSPQRILHSMSPLRAARSVSRSWSRTRSPLQPRGPSLEKLTVVLTSKDKKKKKKKKEEKRTKISDSKRKKPGSSKEVFASGDNVLVSVNFSRTNKTGNNPPLVSISPVREVAKKKKRAADGVERAIKKTKSSGAVSKTVVDAALATGKRKKVTRLNEKEAEQILNRKPVAVIDLDMSPYREQTPSPVNVVVVSDSGSGDEGKAPSPPRAVNQDVTMLSSVATTTAPYLMSSSGPKTPPEPSVKFSINKTQNILRTINNPLGDDDDVGEEELGDGEKDRRGEQETDAAMEVLHKGPNTPPEPRGPSTPKSPPSPQTSPDAYDPFEPTKSRSPSPAHDDVEIEKVVVLESEEPPVGTVAPSDVESMPPSEVTDVTREDAAKEIIDATEVPVSGDGTTSQLENQEPSYAVVAPKPIPNLAKKAAPPPIAPISVANMPIFSLPSPNKTPNRQSGAVALQVSGIQRLQHRLGSPVNKTPNSVKSTPEKRGADVISSGNYQAVNAGKRNGEGKPRPPLQDSTNETVDMDDSPYSPASSEGDDLFDPPAELSVTPVKPAKVLPPVIPSKPAPKVAPAVKPSKFDALFGSSPLKNGSKKLPKPIKPAKPTPKTSKKASKKGISMKMDEDQLRILDELPSSAVELQVKDKFLKKLNRQERVVDEVKTVLKPHYARKHITKEEYKDILRRAVPKICHSKSGEINPSKIQGLVEAYVKRYRHAKKKTTGGVQKPKFKKSNLFS